VSLCSPSTLSILISIAESMWNSCNASITSRVVNGCIELRLYVNVTLFPFYKYL
jgi:hypothetical protein